MTGWCVTWRDVRPESFSGSSGGEVLVGQLRGGSPRGVGEDFPDWGGRPAQVGPGDRAEAPTVGHGETPATVKCLSGTRQRRNGQRRDRGEIGTFAKTFGRDQVERGRAAPEDVAVPFDIDLLLIECPAELEQYAGHVAGGTDNASRFDDRVSIGGGAAAGGAGFQFVENE
jgi:hypothetical protein